MNSQNAGVITAFEGLSAPIGSANNIIAVIVPRRSHIDTNTNLIRAEVRYKTARMKMKLSIELYERDDFTTRNGREN